MNHHHHLIACLLAAFAAAASAQPDRVALASLSDGQLAAAYLRCDRGASDGFLGFGEAADCSMLYEELKQRVFGGNFERLLAWWRAERTAAAQGGLPAAPAPRP